MTERFVSPYPPPEGLDRELLTIIAEEGAEVTQRATKALRFGIPEVQPGQPMTNAQRLAGEIGDLIETVEMAIKRGILDRQFIENGRLAKRRQLARYLQAFEAVAEQR